MSKSNVEIMISQNMIFDRLHIVSIMCFQIGVLIPKIIKFCGNLVFSTNYKIGCKNSELSFVGFRITKFMIVIYEKYQI